MGFNKKLVAKVEAVAAKFGGTVDAENEQALTADAPIGKVWSANECHCIVAGTMRGPQSWYVEAVDTLLEELAMGTSDCLDPDCDICHDEEENA